MEGQLQQVARGSEDTTTVHKCFQVDLAAVLLFLLSYGENKVELDVVRVPVVDCA